MKIAVLGGTGKEGSGLGMRWAHAGHDVVIGSRDAEKAQRVAEELNLALGDGQIKGAGNEAAAQEADVVVVSVNPLDDRGAAPISWANKGFVIRQFTNQSEAGK